MGKELYEDMCSYINKQQRPSILANWEFVDSLDYREDLLRFKEKNPERHTAEVYVFMEELEDKFNGNGLPECCGREYGYLFNWIGDSEFSEYLLRRYPDIIEKIDETNNGEPDMYCNYYYWFVWKN